MAIGPALVRKPRIWSRSRTGWGRRRGAGWCDKRITALCTVAQVLVEHRGGRTTMRERIRSSMP